MNPLKVFKPFKYVLDTAFLHKNPRSRTKWKCFVFMDEYKNISMSF